MFYIVIGSKKFKVLNKIGSPDKCVLQSSRP
jgi:hypothetical protein